MGAFTVGDVVLVKFPFSDLSHQKIRPAFVVGLSEFDNPIVCQITSASKSPKTSVVVKESDFAKGGGLVRTSFIRANKIFTADPKIITKKIGSLQPSVQKQVYTTLLQVFSPLAA